LTEARSGRPVRIGGTELAWGEGERPSLQLRARDVQALDSAGHVLSRAKYMAIGLRFSALLTGHVSVTDILLDGGQITYTNRRDGSGTLAFGPPGAQPDIVIPPPPPNETMRQRAARLLDGLRATMKPLGAGGQLNSVRMRNARLTIADERNGGVWVGDDAAFELARAGKALNMRASASLKGPKGPAPFDATITTDTGFNAATIDVSVNGARPQALGPFAPKGLLAGLSAPATLAVKAGLDRDKGVTMLTGDLTLGRGVLDYGGGRLALDGGRLSGRYDVDHDTLFIRDVSLNGAKTRMSGEARIDHASAALRGEGDQTADFSIASPQIRFEMPGAFSAPVSMSNVAIVGALKPSEIDFSKIQGQIEGARLNLAGRIYWADDGKGVVRPGIEGAGTVDGALAGKTVVGVWPLQLAEGARTWLGESLLDGRIYNIAVKADIKPADFAGDDGIPNDALSVKFKYDRASVIYFRGMTPIVGGYGDAELQGNAFFLHMIGGAVGDMKVSKGEVSLPRLYPKGALATYAGHVDGSARSMVDLLRQAPIGLDRNLPFTPATIVGAGGVDFAFQRPLRKDAGDDDLLFKIDGRIENAGGTAKTGLYTISQWRLHAYGDQDQLTFTGPLAIGAKSRGDLTWSQKLRGDMASPSSVTLKGRLEAADIVSLGFPVMEYARGPVGVDMRAAGRGADANSGAVALDFRDAVVTLPKGFWVKPAGQAFSTTFTLARQRDNTLQLNDIDVAGAGVSGAGTARLSSGGDLIEGRSARLVLPGSMDGAVTARRNGAGVLDVQVIGPFLNIGPFFAPDPAARIASLSAAPPPGPPARGKLSPAFQISGRADKIRMRADADLAHGSVFAASDGYALTKFALDGVDPAGKQFSMAITPSPGQAVGTLTLKAGDAGFAVRGITGQTNIRGGTVEASGTWRFAPNPTAQIQLKMRDFRLVQVPAMAQLLGSVASLTGMVDMLNGDGIQFGDLDAPMTMANNQLTLGECRAAGPAIGLTAKGGINLNNGNLNIDGVIVPSYGINSLLGNLPVLGDLLVSRKGEGVFGLTYSLDGPADKPKVGVNPLSAFTPGIFRRIFEPLQKKEPAKAG
jgi:hypothetical protein